MTGPNKKKKVGEEDEKKFLFHGYDFFSIIFIPLIIFIPVWNLGRSTNPTFLHKESQLKAAWLIFTLITKKT